VSFEGSEENQNEKRKLEEVKIEKKENFQETNLQSFFKNLNFQIKKENWKMFKVLKKT
jgi:hypothetical protein